MSPKDNNGKETRQTNTVISYVVDDTTIPEHIAKETGTFKYQGRMYTFVKLRMNKEISTHLYKRPKDAKVVATNNSATSVVVMFPHKSEYVDQGPTVIDNPRSSHKR